MTLLAGLLLIILFLAFFIYFSGLNPQDVTVFLYADHSFTTSAAILVIACIAVGLTFGVVANFFNLLTYQMKTMRNKNREKRDKEVTSTYREGMSRLLSGDTKKAQPLLQKALDRDSSRLESYLAMASVHIQEGDAVEGISVLNRAREIDPKALEVLFKLATTYEEIGQNDEAAKLYEEILSLEGTNRKALRSLRDIKIKQSLWKEALDLQKRVIKAAQGGKRVKQEQDKQLSLRYEVARHALLEANDGQGKAELKELKDIIKAAPDFAPARVTLGDALRSQGKTDAASQTWLEGYKALGKSVFLSRLEELYMTAEDPTTLLGIYRSALAERGDDLMFRLFFGKLYLRLEMVDEALEQLAFVKDAGVDVPQLHLLLGEAHRRRNRIDEAIAVYQVALGLEPRLRLGFTCETCDEASPEWQSRCPKCGNWGSYVLEGRQMMVAKAAPATEPEARAIHHGERSA